MSLIATILVAAIALLHLYILVLEMALWTKPAGRKAFGMTPEQAEQTKVLAANQGLYNGFLAAGLVWSLFYPDRVVGEHIQLFFLACIAVAGLYGAATAKRSILFIQTLPAAIAALLLLLS